MALSISSPVTGGAQTGFTSPVYTVLADSNPDNNAKQWYVSAVGGAGNTPALHSASVPFFTSVWKPKVFQALGKPHPVTGLLTNVPMNQFKIVTGKGAVPLAGQPAKTSVIRSLIDIPAGADVADAVALRAALSLHIGVLWQLSAELGNSVVSGTI